jgi:SHS2 domain-containing protein
MGTLFHVYEPLSIKCLSIKTNEKKLVCTEKLVSINFNILAKVLVFLWSERMCFVPFSLASNENKSEKGFYYAGDDIK